MLKEGNVASFHFSTMNSSYKRWKNTKRSNKALHAEITHPKLPLRFLDETLNRLSLYFMMSSQFESDSLFYHWIIQSEDKSSFQSH